MMDFYEHTLIDHRQVQECGNLYWESHETKAKAEPVADFWPVTEGKRELKRHLNKYARVDANAYTNTYTPLGRGQR